VKLTRGEGQVNDFRDCRDKNKCALLEKPSGDRIRIRLLVITVRQNLEDFRFRSRNQKVL